MKKDKAFDIKLKDGRYFKNVTPCDEDSALKDKAQILDSGYRDDDGNKANDKIYLYHVNDYERDYELAEIISDDIEYIYEAYEG